MKYRPDGEPCSARFERHQPEIPICAKMMPMGHCVLREGHAGEHKSYDDLHKQWEAKQKR